MSPTAHLSLSSARSRILGYPRLEVCYVCQGYLLIGLELPEHAWYSCSYVPLTFLLALRLAFSASTRTSMMMSPSTVYLTLNMVKYGTASNVDATFTCTDTDSTSRDQLPLWEAASRKGVEDSSTSL
ncbi:hypothetical protein FOZ61_005346, partial [Perkinsus olseni]